MTYKTLMQAVGGPLYFARELDCSLRTIYMWATNGLPRSYGTRINIIAAVERAEIEPELKALCLKYVRDPAN